MGDYAELVKVFKALADEKRLQIMDMIRGGEKCANVILADMQISQPTLSHHMKILCASGLVRARKEGKWVYYSLDPEGGKMAVLLLHTLTTI